MIPALDALQRLREGNARFASGDRCLETFLGHTERDKHVDSQNPFAIILGCSDSRVPVEMVFDQGLGDLFVIRVAGNIVAPSQIGSIEFAAEQYGAQLVVVMGHSQCGAVNATIEQLLRPTDRQSPNLRTIVDRIRPAVEGLLDDQPSHDRESLARHAIRANVRASVENLRHGSEIIEGLVQNEGLLVVGAEYSLESGVVEFLDEISK